MNADESITGGVREENLRPPGTPRVLIVDDDEEASRVIAELVRDLGYEPLRCNEVSAALDLVRSEGIALVLADYRMPEMTGLDLVRMLREDGCNVPVIMMTGYVGTLDRLSSERGDYLTILKKPFGQEDLHRVIQERLPSSTAPAGSF
jgi:CheY-like chemotaxis protein